MELLQRRSKDVLKMLEARLDQLAHILVWLAVRNLIMRWLKLLIWTPRHTLEYGSCSRIQLLHANRPKMSHVPITSSMYVPLRAIEKFQPSVRSASNSSAHRRNCHRYWIIIDTYAIIMETKKTSTIVRRTESTTCGTTRHTCWNSRSRSRLWFALLHQCTVISNSTSFWTKRMVLTHMSCLCELIKKIIISPFSLFSRKAVIISSSSLCLMLLCCKYRARLCIWNLQWWRVRLPKKACK